jgi:hypothetical protein
VVHIVLITVREIIARNIGPTRHAKVFNEETLLTYINYRQHWGLRTPSLPSIPVPYPRHYVFREGAWQCYEEMIALINYDIAREFENEYEENEEEYHNLIEGVPINEQD